VAEWFSSCAFGEEGRFFVWGRFVRFWVRCFGPSPSICKEGLCLDESSLVEDAWAVGDEFICDVRVLLQWVRDDTVACLRELFGLA